MEQSFFTGQMTFVPPAASVSNHWRGQQSNYHNQ